MKKVGTKVWRTRDEKWKRVRCVRGIKNTGLHENIRGVNVTSLSRTRLFGRNSMFWVSLWDSQGCHVLSDEILKSVTWYTGRVPRRRRRSEYEGLSGLDTQRVGVVERIVCRPRVIYKRPNLTLVPILFHEIQNMYNNDHYSHLLKMKLLFCAVHFYLEFD